MVKLTNISIREARDDDADGLIGLIGDVFKEYQGCVLDLDKLDAELLAIDTYIKGLRGKFWLAELEGRILGCIGFAQKEGAVVELKRLYVAKQARRAGLASKLTQLVFDAAGDVNASAIELWSDTRFTEAHAFYLAKGFEKLPESRRLYDPSNSTEHHFIKHL